MLSVKMEVWGPLACFTRCEMHTERASYDVITPSAARGILESVYWHAGLKYTIDRIYVMNPIRFTNIRRNEVSVKALASDIQSMARGGSIPHIYTSETIQQRACMMLTDVRYVIEAHFDMTDRASPEDNPGKFQDIIKRRLSNGRCYSQPYLGTRECTAHFRLWEGGEVPTIPESRDLGYILYDMDYSDLQNIQPVFFHAKMVNGVIDLKDCGVTG